MILCLDLQKPLAKLTNTTSMCGEPLSMHLAKALGMEEFVTFYSS